MTAGMQLDMLSWELCANSTGNVFKQLFSVSTVCVNCLGAPVSSLNIHPL